MIRRPPRSTLFPYHDALPISRLLHRAVRDDLADVEDDVVPRVEDDAVGGPSERVVDAALQGGLGDRKSTRLNSSHANISYAVFCLKKKKKRTKNTVPLYTNTS